MATVERAQKTQEAAPRTKARGHLSLVEWNAEAHPLSAQAPKLTDPVRRTIGDRLYECGSFLIMATTTFAIIASFTHL